MNVVFRGARVLTLKTHGESVRGPLRGEALGSWDVLERADVLVEGGRIARVEERIADVKGSQEIDARGRVLMPGFVDCHTHLCWAGDRLDEWELRRAGASYLEILKAGGGIMSTVRAVRAASEEELTRALRERLRVALREGTTTVEVKSGYGLSTVDELKMLRSICGVGNGDGSESGCAKKSATQPERSCSGAQNRGALPDVVPTALLGHAIDPARPNIVNETIDETLGAVSRAFPGVCVDAYCEEGAWSVDACARLFARAKGLGHACRVHADQFNALGMTALAAERGFRSVDHLEAATEDDLRALARSETFGVMLPCSGFHVDGRYADGRAFVDAGGALAIATNCNPGSAPTSSMPFAIALAARELGLSAKEAIGASTRNGAAVLGLNDRGVIAPGARADLILLRHTDERALAYEFGGDPVEAVVRGGDVVRIQ